MLFVCVKSRPDRFLRPKVDKREKAFTMTADVCQKLKVERYLVKLKDIFERKWVNSNNEDISLNVKMHISYVQPVNRNH